LSEEYLDICAGKPLRKNVICIVYEPF